MGICFSALSDDTLLTNDQGPNGGSGAVAMGAGAAAAGAAAAGAAPDRAVIQFVIQELFAADDVGEFVRMVVDAVARGSAGGFVSRVGGAQAPPPVAQLLALVTLSLAVTKTAA